MVALAEGTRSPEIELKSLAGRTYKLDEALTSGPVVLAFYKATCPVCQMTLPFIERIAQAHPERSIWAVSQDDADETRDFVDSYELTLPVLLDEALQKSVEFDLTNVPSIFLIGQDGSIEQTIIGFDKAALERLHATVSQVDSGGTDAKTLTNLKLASSPLFSPDDQVPEFRPG
jgi:Peroxiredoxin